MPSNRFVPEDPRAADQWHLQRLGDLPAIWADYRGSGVHVGVYDDGVELAHPDLDDAIDLSLSPIFEGEPLPLDAVRRFADHGTPVAGLIAAEANGRGTVGVAFEASIGGAIINGPGRTKGREARDAIFDQMDLFDITNHSWGHDPQFERFGAESRAVLAGYERTAQEGRDGLGTIHMKAVANLLTHAQAEDIQSSRYTINVSALNDEGLVSGFAARGTNLTVLSPTDDDFGNLSVVTTDRTGSIGDTAGNVTSFFGGTSAATPIASGVVALMLDANPGLGWRDVQEILAQSARHTGALPDDEPTGNSFYSARINGAETWNGGGYHVSEDYGFGAIDAFAAVRLAEAARLIGATAATSENEVTLNGPKARSLDQRIPGNGTPLEVTLAMDAGTDFIAEHVTLQLSLTHTRLSDLQVELTSPSGTTVTLLDPRLSEEDRRPFNAAADDGLTWPLDITLFRGESVTGDWTVQVTDIRTGQTGTLEGLGLTFHGAAETNDTTYVYTDEILDALRLQPNRLTLTDTSGTDWLNFAPLTSILQIDLASGARTEETEIVQFGPGTQIENVLGGNRADTITGNTADNTLLGMRGGDQLSGREGDDTLGGGKGRDLIKGNAGDDVLRGGQGPDRLVDGSGADRLLGGPGSDVFVLTLDDDTDLIADYQAGVDRIRLPGTASDVVQVETLRPGRVAIDYATDRLIVQDGGAGTLVAEDITFSVV